MAMATVMFRCPTTGYRVQEWFSDDASEDSDNTYRSVLCVACQRVHLVNPGSGKVFGVVEESKDNLDLRRDSEV